MVVELTYWYFCYMPNPFPACAIRGTHRKRKIPTLSCLRHDPSFNFSINLCESDIDSFGCPCSKGWSTLSFWYDDMESLLRSEIVLLPLKSAGECLGLYPELLETGVAPFTAVGSGHGVKTNARGILKRHEPWDLFVNISINIKLSKNVKEKKLVRKSKRTARNKQNITF